MTDTDTAELVAAFRAYIAACSGPGTTLYDGHPAVLMSKGIDRLTALERERDEATVIARSLTKALVQLTPGGSEYFTRHGEEYFADIEACHRVIRDRFDSGHRAKLERVDQRRRAEEAERALTASQAEVERLKEALKEARKTMRNAAGAIQSRQTEEKEVDRQLRLGYERVDAALQPQVGKP